MIKLNGEQLKYEHFPDKTLLIKKSIGDKMSNTATITWLFENNEELVTLIFLTKHLRSHGVEKIHLDMPYIPNARQDRVKLPEDVFTLKYFAEIINDLKFKTVTVLDPHSNVSAALINNIVIKHPVEYIEKVISKIEKSTPADTDAIIMFYPDEGAMKRYSEMIDKPYTFGIKKRDWKTGEIKGLDVSGMTELINGSKIIIVDDISSRGGTFYHSAKKLKELGAKDIYLYVSHCENTILEGDVLNSELIKKVFTTDSIFTQKHEKVEVMSYE